ncbi:MAG: hypothetical protein HY695_12095 [Deltaproteobacteria bacterium]|nr:hypothetical protein [Deltaproteobacteria bacterium]
MGFDCTYTVFDQSEFDKILDKTFRELVSGLRRKTWYDWLDGGFRDCYGFSEGYTEENGPVDRYLNRTVRHALSQNGFVYWTLWRLLDLVGKNVLPRIGCYIRGAAHEEILLNMAVRAFLKRKLGAPTLYAVLKLHYVSEDEPWFKQFFCGNRERYRSFRGYAKTRSLAAPLYKWQCPILWGDITQKINCLGTADFKLWLSFLQKAYAKDWLPRDVNDPVWSIFAADAHLATTVSHYRRIYYGMARGLSGLRYKKPVIIYSLS